MPLWFTPAVATAAIETAVIPLLALATAKGYQMITRPNRPKKRIKR